jgi:spore germination protein YaaH
MLLPAIRNGTPEVNDYLPPDYSIFSQIDYSKASTQIPAVQPSKLKQTAWIPDWAFDAGYKTLSQDYQYFESVSPVWYYLEADGKLRSNKVGLAKLKQFCNQHGIKLIPSIANFDADQLSLILSNPDKLQEHIQFIKNEVRDNGYDGFDIDYESINLHDQNNFLTLLRELSADFRSQNKILSVAVLAQWADDPIYTSLKQTRKVQNWSAMEPYIDELRIMTYDYTSQRANIPGPIAPLDWQEAVIRYALRSVPASKIMIGANLYGYVWEDLNNSPETYPHYLENTTLRDTPATALTMNQLADRERNFLVKRFDDKSGELSFTYRRDGKLYRAYAPSVEQNQKRVELASRLGIKGIAYWRLGDENNAILRLIK